MLALLDQIDGAITALVSGGVSSYSLGNRSLTYQNLSELYKLRDETEARVEELEAKLSGRPPRGVTTHVFLDPSIIIPRR